MFQAGPRSFECAGDRFGCRVQHVGHLGGVESQDVTQDEHSDLAGRQDLKGSHEGQRDSFGLLVPGFRPRRLRGGAGKE